MSNNQEVLAEEFEVLESIYPDELEKLGDNEIQISVAPEEQIPGEELRLLLHVEYPPEYPDVTPALTLTPEEGEITSSEETVLMQKITASAEESIGMAQTFSIVSTLIEGIGETIQSRVKEKEEARAKKEREIEEAELRRKQGTLVTPESFLGWRNKFLKERVVEKQAREEERMKEMSNKEKEEYKKFAGRLTGRQLFERNRDLVMSDDTLVDDGANSVDITKYNRNQIEEEEQRDEDRIEFSDSD